MFSLDHVTNNVRGRSVSARVAEPFIAYSAFDDGRFAVDATVSSRRETGMSGHTILHLLLHTPISLLACIMR